MIIYFADRYMNILGMASTELPEGLTVTDDLKTEDIETGVASLELTIHFDADTRAKAESCAAVGNYILKKGADGDEFYTIIESEVDTGRHDVQIYAEDAGLDLINEVVGAYSASQAYPISHYVNKYVNDSGFVIGINEVSTLTRKLSWEGEATATERLASVATQFDGCEISYSFEIEGLEVKKKFVNIHKQRGKDVGIQLRLNKEVDRIITKKSIANLATALQCTGGTPDDSESPITLKGYSYDDGDFYVDSEGILRSRKAVQTWGRLVGNNMSHIAKQYSYDTTSKQTLCARAITELKKIREMELNFEVEVNDWPDNVSIGDRVNIIDDAGELYLSTRLLQLETSEVNQSKMATLGEHLLKSSGISQKVIELAANFAKMTVSVQQAQKIANAAKTAANAAQTQAEEAATNATKAQEAASAASDAATKAEQSAEEATKAANAAEAQVEEVNTMVSGIEKTVENANKAAENAEAAAEEAKKQAETAAQSATNAEQDAADAERAAGDAKTTAEEAVQTANEAKSAADESKAKSEEAASTAAGAKEDAKLAQQKLDEFKEGIETEVKTMKAEYARKTDLSELESDMQTKIAQNAAEIASTASSVTKIDETANDAQKQLQGALAYAEKAQELADEATAEAEVAQEAANEATAAAEAAQSEADAARSAADTAQSVADKAAADLEAAEEGLATVQERADATEEEIAEAQAAVNTAKAAADIAQADAEAAALVAKEAQKVASEAVYTATEAQFAAANAAKNANIAQQAAEQAKGDATAAQNTADEAKATADAAQATANTARANADAAQATADAAAQSAADSQAAADKAEEKALAAEADLATAQQNLEEVMAKVDATEKEVAAAQAYVEQAQAAATTARSEANAAQTTADTAQADAEAAQAAADEAKTAADEAQADADEAWKAYDNAKVLVGGLVVRMIDAETQIRQNADKIELRATKREVTKTLGGYYTKEQSDAKLTVKANEITSSVANTYATKTALAAAETLIEQNQESITLRATKAELQSAVGGVQVGGRNLIKDSANLDFEVETTADTTNQNVSIGYFSDYYFAERAAGKQITLSFDWETTATEGRFFPQFNNAPWGGFSSSYYIYPSSTNQSGKLVATTTLTEGYVADTATYKGLVVRIDGVNGVTKISNVKCEFGNKATTWTQAPEDVQASLDENADAAYNAQHTGDEAKAIASEATAQIQVLSDMISSLVTDENGASLMTQTATGGWSFNMGQTNAELSAVSSSLDALQKTTGDTQATVSVLQQAVNEFGLLSDYVKISTIGRNLLLGTGESSTIEGTNTTNQESADKYVLVENIDEYAGKTLTISFEYTVSGYTSGHFAAQFGWKSWQTIGTITPSGNGTFTYSKTFTRSTTAGDTIVRFRLDNFVGTVTISKMKVEVGSAATEWTPAPEDLGMGNMGAYYTEPCVELGKKDSDFKVRITNTSVLFVYGSAVPAYITSQSLHIGKAVIEDELQIGGHFVWQERANGNLGLMWKG